VRSNVYTAGNSGRYTISDQGASLGDDIIAAIECLKSWFMEEISCGDSKDVGRHADGSRVVRWRVLE